MSLNFSKNIFVIIMSLRQLQSLLCGILVLILVLYCHAYDLGMIQTIAGSASGIGDGGPASDGNINSQ